MPSTNYLVLPEIWKTWCYRCFSVVPLTMTSILYKVVIFLREMKDILCKILIKANRPAIIVFWYQKIMSKTKEVEMGWWIHCSPFIWCKPCKPSAKSQTTLNISQILVWDNNYESSSKDCVCLQGIKRSKLLISLISSGYRARLFRWMATSVFLFSFLFVSLLFLVLLF